LAAELSDLRPAEGFTEAVMAAVERDRSLWAPPAERTASWSDGVWRSGGPALALAAAAAVACLLLSWSAQDKLDADVLATVDVVEVVE